MADLVRLSPAVAPSKTGHYILDPPTAFRVLTGVFIRVKIRKLKSSPDGKGRVSWDFRLVESRRIPGVSSPRQRTLAALGAIRPDARGDRGLYFHTSALDRFRAGMIAKIEGAGVTPTPDLLAPADAWLKRLLPEFARAQWPKTHPPPPAASCSNSASG